MLTSAIRESIDESVLCWLATVSKTGDPNVSPKEVFLAFADDEIVIANIASPISVRNILHNPKVCISFVHVFKQKGFKLYGTADYLTDGHPDYSARFAEVDKVTKGVYPVKGIIRVCVNKVTPIIAPSYLLFPESTEETLTNQAKKQYGVS